MPPEIEEEQWRCTICRMDCEGEPEGRLFDGTPYCENCIDSTIECYHCDDVYEDDDSGYYTIIDGERYVCYDCNNNHGYEECGRCGYQTHPSDICGTTNDGMVCNTCYEDYRSCDGCNDIISEAYEVNNQSLCLGCARRSVECIISDALDIVDDYDSGEVDEEEYEEAIHEIRGALNFVPHVGAYGFASRSSYLCSNCGSNAYGLPQNADPISVARMLYARSMDDALCRVCAGNGEPVTYSVMNYSYKPKPKFRRTQRDFDSRSLHFGTEVEVDMAVDVPRDRALKQLADADSERLFYCKHDVSCGEGFEVVTHPFTFDWMKDNPDAFSPMFDLAPIMRGWEAKRCGMHIHMSKDAFTELQMFKFMRFFHLNIRFIRALARRPTGKFDKWAKMNAPDRSKLIKFSLTGMGVSLGRGALNLENEDTIECRIFRSSLSPTAYYGNIEFLQSLFDYTKNCGVDDEQLSKQRLMDYASNRGRIYKNFILLSETIRPEIDDRWEVECA